MSESKSQIHDAPSVPVRRHDHAHGALADGGGETPTYVDPVCGMTVPANSHKTVNYQSETYYFCSDKCKAKFSTNPAQFLKPTVPAVTTSTAAPAGSTSAGVVYTCPMHPEIRQIGPGTCPKCGMALEPLVGDGRGGRLRAWRHESPLMG